MTTKEAVALLERYSNYDGMGIPNLAGCKEAMRVAVDALKEVCPELAESEDERIRKSIIEHFKQSEKAFPGLTFGGYYYADVLAWLEKQKKQKPAEWSEEDEKWFDYFERLLEFGYNKDPHYLGKLCIGGKMWLRSLRRSWKPSEEQIEALRRALRINPVSGKLYYLKEDEVCILQSLLRELEKLIQI